MKNYKLQTTLAPTDFHYTETKHFSKILLLCTDVQILSNMRVNDMRYVN